jgi:nucleotide-binding universal stress UspA family protein
MFDKIVTLWDGSTLAHRVLAHTRVLARAYQADVTLLHVLEPQEKSDTGRLDTVNWHLRKIEAQSSLNAVAQEWEDNDLRLKTELLEGHAANRIIEYIDKSDPDLIMLSSHGQSGLSPWNVNSVAHKVIGRAYRSLMLVRAYGQQCEDRNAKQYRRIVVPLDGSKRAECVLPFASRLAADQGAELVLVHALVPPTMMQTHTLTPEEVEIIERLDRRNRETAKRYLTETAVQIKLETVTELLSGANTVDVLLEFAANNEIDLIVMSAHGRASDTMRPYGSVASSFIDYGSTSLLVIQDLPQDQIKPTQAEIHANSDDADTGRMNRKNAYAQPANWSADFHLR